MECTVQQNANRRVSIQVSETNDEGIIHVPQRMRPHTGLGKTSAEGGWVGSASHNMLISSGAASGGMQTG